MIPFKMFRIIAHIAIRITSRWQGRKRIDGNNHVMKYANAKCDDCEPARYQLIPVQVIPSLNARIPFKLI